MLNPMHSYTEKTPFDQWEVMIEFNNLIDDVFLPLDKEN